MSLLTLVQFYERLEKHDWYCCMADDFRREREGINEEKALMRIGREGPEYQKLFDEYKEYAWSGPAFDTPKLAKPGKPTD